MRGYQVVQSKFFDDGTVVLPYNGPDWGLKAYHEAKTGVKHVNVSLDGRVPFVTIPRSALMAVIIPSPKEE